VRLDHLLSKEHIPRTVANRPGLLGWSVWLALVVFTSGIVDDALVCVAVSSQYYSLFVPSGVRVVGVEPGGVVGWVGVDTLLSPEASAVRQVPSGIFVRCDGGWGFLCLSGPVRRWVVWPGWVCSL
jgi:hypothetical protein